MIEHAEKRYLAVAGLAKAGKTAIVHTLREHYGFAVIRPSDIIRDALVAERGSRLYSRAELRIKGEEMRRKLGPAYYLESPATEAPRVLIDGPRHFDSIQAIRARGGFVIGMIARPEVRYMRSIANPEKAVFATLDEFVEDESKELNNQEGTGGQLQMVLDSIPAEDIIDTSDMTLVESSTVLHAIMRRHSIEPIDEKKY